ncbi:patatin-like phospholipase [Aspergillus ambiguus]|uniref:patatin-like phospholipase family protein n=1 Tax=Aspergillus ambiguus TaxID=176160 RepID=UPI003CCE3DA1
MRPSEDIGWLDVGLGGHTHFTLLDYGRMERLITELADPINQSPSLCVFIGNKRKDRCLPKLYPSNNIKRHTSKAAIRLRYDMESMETRRPILVVDGDLSCKPIPSLPERVKVDDERLIAWSAPDADSVLRTVWARLVFLFADVICIFVDDFDDTTVVTGFFLECLRHGSASSMPRAVRPRVIIILATAQENGVDTVQKAQGLHGELIHSPCGSVSDVFSAIQLIHLEDSPTPDRASYDRVRALIAGQLNDMYVVRGDHHALVNGTHLGAFFRSAFHEVVKNIDRPFDFIRCTRESSTVSRSLKANLTYYLRAGMQAGLGCPDLAPSIASALLMDHYVPGMFAAEPRAMFRTLYSSAIEEAVRGEIVGLVEGQIVEQFDQLHRTGVSSSQSRKRQLQAQSGQLCSIRSNRICLLCLVFGSPAVGVEYRFTLASCLCCLYQRPLVVDVLPPTMNPTILAIDGGGVRGVIPLEYLNLIQEALGSYPLRDLVDLGIGTSSGGLSIIGLFNKEWDVRECSEIFDRLARRIFSQRRNSLFSQVSQAVLGGNTIFGRLQKWATWLLHDGCYDGRVFDSALQEAFEGDRCIFDALCTKGSTLTRSKARFGVIATSIARETWPFVFGNFNAAVLPKDEECDHEIVRPADVHLEPRVWEAFFTPVDIQGIGSFQDGGLRNNLAADIALRLSRRIWPSRKNPARLLSMGTGITVRARDRSPHFRHVFQDGFLRRGFDAWMSTMDTEVKWQEMVNQLDETVKQDYIRFNIQLHETEYRNLVILSPGSARLAREAATALLASRFFLVLDRLPAGTVTPYWCRGTIHCKGRAKELLSVLLELHPQGLVWATDSEPLSRMVDPHELCVDCGRYYQKVSFLIVNPDRAMNIYLRTRDKRRWRISGFPDSIMSLSAKQQLGTPFGRYDHGSPAVAPCHSCDGFREGTLGVRRRRSSADARNKRTKRVRRGSEKWSR